MKLNVFLNDDEIRQATKATYSIVHRVMSGKKVQVLCIAYDNDLSVIDAERQSYTGFERESQNYMTIVCTFIKKYNNNNVCIVVWG